MSLAQIPSYDRQLRARLGQATEEKLTGANGGRAERYITYVIRAYAQKDSRKEDTDKWAVHEN